MKNKINSILAVLAFACAALFALPACNTTTGQQKIVAKLAVQYAVLKVTDKHPEKAARIVSIAREVQALAGGDGANTVDLLVGLIKAKVDFSKLDAADTLLANALIDTIGEQLKERVGSGTLSPDKLPLVAEVAKWVIEGAGAVVPPTG
jgi:predicted negative regulator of RcsB-dependent stress response